jgi:hypothetical protein
MAQAYVMAWVGGWARGSFPSLNPLLFQTRIPRAHAQTALPPLYAQGSGLACTCGHPLSPWPPLAFSELSSPSRILRVPDMFYRCGTQHLSPKLPNPPLPAPSHPFSPRPPPLAHAGFQPGLHV